jgi:hypothetical protein
MDNVVTLRPVVIFVAAYTIILILHESAHAAAAYVVKVPFVLYHLYVRIDPASRTLSQGAVIGVSGPLFCLAVGLVCWLAYDRTRNSRAGLWLLYLGWFGIATLLGNLMSTAFVGDFSALAQMFDVPMPVRYVVTLFGALSLCAFAFLMGKELRNWAPAGASRVKALIGMIAVPVIAGTALALLVYLPMPSPFAVGRIGESFFWIFATVGILLTRKQVSEPPPLLSLWERPGEGAKLAGGHITSVLVPQPSPAGIGLGEGRSIAAGSINNPLRLSWVDVAILLVAIGVVRVMATGVIHVP